MLISAIIDQIYFSIILDFIFNPGNRIAVCLCINQIIIVEYDIIVVFFIFSFSIFAFFISDASPGSTVVADA